MVISEIQDPEARALANYAQTLRSGYKNTNEAWTESPFAWLSPWPSSRTKGKIGEELVASYLAHKGFDVTRSPDSEADRIIAGHRAEIKMSTLWKTGFYKFQQLRDQNYSFAICLGISPFEVHCWVLPKKIIMERRATGDIRSQHRGSSGRDTAWLHVKIGNIPDWLKPWGGSLSDAVSRIKEITKQEPS